ncbi:MAG: biotin--[acetyl-CoA-carboxylase] ligase [Bacillaceae bacterium]|nr:biotin--[acetyl-CoA-carboxylase] ligase [Bacillaceae bacterium]
MKETLIKLFKDAGERYISGEELSRQLGCTRAAIWKHIEELRKEGYQFEAVRRSGYRLIKSPDILTPQEIQYNLDTERIGQTIHYFKQLESTQIVAHQLADQGETEGTIVIADEQTGGRGRLGRVWHSPPGTGIWMSLILKPNIPLKMAPQLTLLTAVAVARAINRVATDLDVNIKWPNDILINRKKICGILTELNAESDRIHYLVIGIGINVNAGPETFPHELKKLATSLKAESRRSFSRARLVREICQNFETLYNIYLKEGFTPIKHLWEAYAILIGEKTRIRTIDGEFSGTVRGIDEDGVLLLELDNGIIKKIFSADIPLE